MEDQQFLFNKTAELWRMVLVYLFAANYVKSRPVKPRFGFIIEEIERIVAEQPEDLG